MRDIEVRHNTGVVYRTVGNETILIPGASKRQELNNLFTLDQVGNFIWNNIPKSGIKVSLLIEQTLENFSDCPAETTDDVTSFISDLLMVGLLEKTN